MNLGELLLLGVVQGLTEFLPVSSSGHLALARAWFVGGERSGVFIEVALHAGTLAAVLLLYRADWLRLARGLGGFLRRPRTEPDPASRTLFLLAVGTVPAAVAGLLLRRPIESLFGSPRAIGLALLGTATVIWFGARAAARAVRPFERIGCADAALVGLAQACALVPGLSRSGLTIAAALGRRIEPVAAARFSFLLSVPVTAGACLLKGIEEAREWGIPEASPFSLLAGIVVAGLVGAASIRALVRLLGRGRLDWFALWCVLVGALALLFSPAKERIG